MKKRECSYLSDKIALNESTKTVSCDFSEFISLRGHNKCNLTI